MANFQVLKIFWFQKQYPKDFVVITKPAKDDHWGKRFLSHFFVSFTLRFLGIKRGAQASETGREGTERFNLLASLGRTSHTIASVFETCKEGAF